MFASVENFRRWKDNVNVNWISIPPQEEHLELRERLGRADLAAARSARLVKEAQEAEAKSQPGLPAPASERQDKAAGT